MNDGETMPRNGASVDIEAAGPSQEARRLRDTLIRSIGWFVVFAAPAAIHLIYGVRDVGLVEEWGVEQLFSVRDTVVFWTPSAPPGGLRGQMIRPLTVAPHSIAYLLDPDSFTGYHFLTALALGLKGLAMLALLTQLRVRRSISIAGAFVFAVFPAWTGLFTFRMLHAQFAVAALVFAMTQMLLFARRPSFMHGALAGVGVGISLMLYESGYVAVLFAPLLLLTVSRFNWRALAYRAAVWYLVPAINAVRIAFVWHTGERQYEHQILTTESRQPFTEAARLVDFVYRRGLLWLISGPFGLTIAFTTVIAVIGVAVAMGVTRCADARRATPTPGAGDASARRYVALSAGSLVAAPIAALIYAPGPALLGDPLRVFSIVCVPLTLAVFAALEALARKSPGGGPVVALALVALAAGSATAQRDHWHNYSQVQEHLIGSIMAASAPVSDATSLVVIDPEHLITGPAGDDLYRLFPETLSSAVNYARPSIETTIVCQGMPDETPGAVPSPGRCVLSDGIVRNTAGEATLAVSAVVEIRATQATAWPATARRLPSHRERSLFHCVALETCDAGLNGVEARLVSLGTGVGIS